MKLPRTDWPRLEQLLRAVDQRTIQGLTADEIDELAILFRHGARELEHQRRLSRAVPQEHEQLVARAYLTVHGRKKVAARSLLDLVRTEVPRAFRAQAGPIACATLVFFSAALSGIIASTLDERSAQWLIGADALDSLRQGELWTRELVRMAPESALSARILTNNIAIALVAFVAGWTLGIGTLFILIVNGLQIGLLIPIVHHYGISTDFWDFVVAHGFLELTMIILAGGAGLGLADAIIAPGSLRRREALRRATRRGLMLLAVSVTGLILSGVAEGFVSTNSGVDFPGKLAVGLSLWLAMLGYLTLAGRSGEESADDAEALAHYAKRRKEKAPASRRAHGRSEGLKKKTTVSG
ncbi:MAG: stage II sporulation protein M [Planctomycetota bacterium]